jgi:hypothetical protein
MAWPQCDTPLINEWEYIGPKFSSWVLDLMVEFVILFMDEYIGPKFSHWVLTTTKVSCLLKGGLGFLLRVKLVWKMNAQKLGLFEARRFATFHISPDDFFFKHNLYDR